MTVEVPCLGSRYRGATLLGEGAFGLVYRAFDEVRGRHVAVKMLRRFEAAHAFELKREFRLLAELSHPHLVTLHELIVDERRAFFTAELLEGEDLSAAWSTLAPSDRLAAVRRWSAGVLLGLGHLAAHGLAHCDLKPANVHVVDHERAVLLDFGLSGRVGARGSRARGTLEYMAPEQILGASPATEGDVYALGTVLFELLYDRLPFPGDTRAIVERKCMGALPHAPDGAGVPADLRDLTLACLRPDPSSRPSIEECLARTGVAGPPIDITPPFFGRTDELERLQQTFCGLGARGALVSVEGPSGIGKSELLRRFCRWAEGQPASLVLVGRCVAREHVRFNALDEIVEALVELLIAQPLLAREVQPSDIAALLRLFPALERVGWTGAVGSAPDSARSATSPEPNTLASLQQRAERAFGELFAALAVRRRLLVWVDDLQWSDADSRALLETLAILTERVPLLVVESHRASHPDERSRAPALAVEPALSLRVGPLARADALRVVTAGGGPTAVELETVVDEIAGDPHLLAELRASLAAIGPRAPGTLREILSGRLLRLSADERRLLVLASLAGVRLPIEVLGRAADVGPTAYDIADRLARVRILRREPGGTREVFEPFHDRIRDAALADLDVERRRALHERLGEALEEAAADPSLIVSHFVAAGRLDRASAPARRAAELAFDTLAFERAAYLYEVALLGPELPPSERGRVLRARGDALAYSGRAVDGARDLLAASELLSGAAALDALSCAAELLIGAGHRESGLSLLRRALEQAGVPLPSSRWGRVLSAVVQRAVLATVGLDGPLPARPGPPRELEVAVAWRASLVLSIYDPAAALDLQARHTRRAFRAGDEGAVARGRAMEVVLLSSMQRRPAYVARLEAGARRSRAALPPSPVRADIDLLLGLADAYRGHFPAALRQLDAAAVDYGEGKVSRWQLAYTRAHRCLVLEYLGAYGDLASQVDLLGDELARGDDRLGRAFLDVGSGYVVDLMEDSAAGARRRIESALAPFARDPPIALQWLELRARVKTALYVGDVPHALACLERARRRLRSLFRFQNVRIEHTRLCAAAALAGGDREGARRALGSLEQERDGWAPGMPALIRGLLAEGDEALLELRQAENVFTTRCMEGFAAAARAYATGGQPHDLPPFARPERWLQTFGG